MYCNIHAARLRKKTKQTIIFFYLTTTFVLGCHCLNTAINVDVLLVFSYHLAYVVMKFSLAVRLAEGNPGMNSIGMSAWDCWVGLAVIII